MKQSFAVLVLLGQASAIQKKSAMKAVMYADDFADAGEAHKSVQSIVQMDKESAVPDTLDELLDEAANSFGMNKNDKKDGDETHSEEQNRLKEIADAKKQEIKDGPKMKAQEEQNRKDREKPLINPHSGNVEHPDGRITDWETGAPVDPDQGIAIKHGKIQNMAQAKGDEETHSEKADREAEVAAAKVQAVKDAQPKVFKQLESEDSHSEAQNRANEVNAAAKEAKDNAHIIEANYKKVKNEDRKAAEKHLVNKFNGVVEHPDGRKTDFETGAPIENGIALKVSKLYKMSQGDENHSEQADREAEVAAAKVQAAKDAQPKVFKAPEPEFDHSSIENTKKEVAAAATQAVKEAPQKEKEHRQGKEKHLINPFSGVVEHPDGRKTDFETGKEIDQNISVRAQVKAKNEQEDKAKKEKEEKEKKEKEEKEKKEKEEKEKKEKEEKKKKEEHEKKEKEREENAKKADKKAEEMAKATMKAVQEGKTTSAESTGGSDSKSLKELEKEQGSHHHHHHKAAKKSEKKHEKKHSHKKEEESEHKHKHHSHAEKKTHKAKESKKEHHKEKESKKEKEHHHKSKHHHKQDPADRNIESEAADKQAKEKHDKEMHPDGLLHKPDGTKVNPTDGQVVEDQSKKAHKHHMIADQKKHVSSSDKKDLEKAEAIANKDIAKHKEQQHSKKKSGGKKADKKYSNPDDEMDDDVLKE